MTADRTAEARALAKLLGVFHNISYYAPEMKAFAEVGLPEYWRAYMAYRSAPMGQVPATVVAATFYNFAPRVVAAAVPSAWDGLSPADAMALRDDCVARALTRALGDLSTSGAVNEAANLALQGIADADVGARPLFASHAELPIPGPPLMQLWYASTLWREFRGDTHNLALAANGIDGVECHVLLSAKGVGGFDIIEQIRGWTRGEWTAASDRLQRRGLIDTDGGFTDAGRQLRQAIELQTDELSAHPRTQLGPVRSGRLIELMEPFVQQLISSGSVPGRWPPPKGVG